VNFRQVLADIVSLDWRYVTVAVVFDLAVYLAHAWRWKILLKPVARVSYWRSVQAIYIGLFANEILPFRTGEVVRCYAAFWLTASFIRLPQYLVDGGQILAIGLIGVVGVFVFIALHKHHAHHMFSRSRWATSIRQTVEHIVEGLHAMGTWRTLLPAGGASFLDLFLQVVPVWALMEAYGLDLSFWAASAVLIVLRLGTVIPNAPGNAGVYQVLCVISLGLFGIDKTTAVGFSWTMFGVLTFPLLVGGFIAVLFTGLNFGEIRRRARTSLQQTPQPAPVTAAEK
jgi:uncharacterized membrane protein YbhN (UPF0104 family)